MNNGNISRIILWAEGIIDGIQVTYGTAVTPRQGGTGGQQSTIDFSPGEYITGIDLDVGSWWGRQIVCRVTIYTNLRTVGPFGQCSNNSCGTYYPPNSYFRYFSGLSDEFVDRLEAHYEQS
eukprot:GHVU01179881.1.p1 GENE.GHVU01179881.1~~GHVU01179881.1.p1  ORF type:complete len:121 (+),score=6.35 GHVU01179881.1:1-363(+)